VTNGVCAVVVNYFRTEESLALISDVITAHGVPADRVCLVSNGHHPEDIALLERAEGRGVHVIVLDNPGYASAVNAGVRAVGGACEHALILTHDVRLDAGLVTTLEDFLDRNPTAAIASPRLLDLRSQDRIWSAGGARTRLRRLPTHLDHGAPSRAFEAGSRSVPWVDGAVFMIRLTAFYEIDGLPTEYFLYMEDVDLGARLTSRGWQLHCLAAASAWQEPGGNLTTYLACRNFLFLTRAEGAGLAAALWTAEHLVRLSVSGWFRRRGPIERQRARLRGLRHGYSRTDGPAPIGQASGGLAKACAEG
jgi:N-acetylglucosaminyl-diphospho-decaprenol L-rhamnosyltransferase